MKEHLRYLPSSQEGSNAIYTVYSARYGTSGFSGVSIGGEEMKLKSEKKDNQMMETEAGV